MRSQPRLAEDLFYSRCPVPTALAIALETGLLAEEFAEDGIRVRSLASSPVAAVRDSHYTHSHPRLIRHGGNIPPLVAIDRGSDLKVVGLSWAEVALPMFTLPESEIERVSDLVGKRLPLPRRSGVSIDCWEPAILRGYERSLAAAGLKLEDVELVPIEVERTFATTRFTAPGEKAPLWDREFILGLQREEVLALIRGDVDAVFSESSTAVTIAAMFGLRQISDLRQVDDPLAQATLPLPVTVTASAALVEQEPLLVARWLAVMERASVRAAENPDEARSILSAEVCVPIDAYADALNPTAHLQLGIDLDDTSLSVLDSQAEFLHQHGYTTSRVDIESIVHDLPLRMAKQLAFEPEPTREVAVPG